ncbi:DUF6090 family protein [Algoriphagus lutimaris]|uniref:DUF6090 family protein n=1 Tax=Algoriphagus lutimaris TaxID=613197 RepID=UPI0021D413B6|nr:DUF6090 family protein [Algoriphagus lutimaris]
MISFFRKIRQKLLSQNKVTRYLVYAIGEIFLVVMGILIALQVNNWNESQKNKATEQKLLRELKDDLSATLEDLKSDIVIASEHLAISDSIYTSLYLKEEPPTDISIDFWFLFKRGSLFAKISSYESIKNTGIDLIQDDALRIQITNFYEMSLMRIVNLESIIAKNRDEIQNILISQKFKQSTSCDTCKNLTELLSQENLDKNILTSINAKTLATDTEFNQSLKLHFIRYNTLNRYYLDAERDIEQMIQSLNDYLK